MSERYWVSRDTDQDIIVIWPYEYKPNWDTIKDYDTGNDVGFWAIPPGGVMHDELDYEKWVEHYGLDIEPGECKLMVATYKWSEGEDNE